RQKQSPKQIGVLTLLIVAAILLSVGESSGKASASSNSDQVLLYGIIPVMIASVLSGLASSFLLLLQVKKKHTSYIMTAIRKYGFFHGWTVWNLIPVVMNAVGGILVGLVTAHAGGVRKASGDYR
ncbi:unnamed protein product, partial [Musa textilis]